MNWHLALATGASRRILSATLNPVIIFLRRFLPTLFTKFASYSQIAACAPEKTISPFRRTADDIAPSIHFAFVRHAPSF
jgi:hypothetical protein